MRGKFIDFFHACQGRGDYDPPVRPEFRWQCLEFLYACAYYLAIVSIGLLFVLTIIYVAGVFSHNSWIWFLK
jgi:hypothetical protein